MESLIAHKSVPHLSSQCALARIAKTYLSTPSLEGLPRLILPHCEWQRQKSCITLTIARFDVAELSTSRGWNFQRNYSETTRLVKLRRGSLQKDSRILHGPLRRGLDSAGQSSAWSGRKSKSVKAVTDMGNTKSKKWLLGEYWLEVRTLGTLFFRWSRREVNKNCQRLDA